MSSTQGRETFQFFSLSNRYLFPSFPALGLDFMTTTGVGVSAKAIKFWKGFF